MIPRLQASITASQGRFPNQRCMSDTMSLQSPLPATNTRAEPIAKHRCVCYKARRKEARAPVGKPPASVFLCIPTIRIH